MTLGSKIWKTGQNFYFFLSRTIFDSLIILGSVQFCGHKTIDSLLESSKSKKKTKNFCFFFLSLMLS